MKKSARATEPPQPSAATDGSMPFRVRSLTNSLFAAFQARVKSATARPEPATVELVPCRE